MVRNWKESIQRWAQRSPLTKRCVAPVRPENRTLFIGRSLVSVEELEGFVPEKFCDNQVVTTKYTPWNFIFKNLWEQLRRIANFYFLIVAIIQLVIPNTPVSPLTSSLPLLFVLFITAVKQAYEDYRRRVEDNKVNKRPYKLVMNGVLVSVESQHIQVGDIIRIEDNEEFPCDMLLLSASNSEGKCSIQTASLDGETNLKTFVSVPDTREFDTPDKLSSLRGFICCQQPITDLYRFLGNLTVFQTNSQLTKALNAQNVLLRGAKLKNTGFIYGCAIYTGLETKLALNSKIKSGKRSKIERRLNTYLIAYLVLMASECIIATSLRYWWLSSWILPDKTRKPWYIPVTFDYLNSEAKVEALAVVLDFLYFYVIFNYLIPISLYVTIELQKFVGSLFFGFDAQMYDERIDEPAKANTSDLNEELGQVEYLFCDKTGTLTENVMDFRQCSINGVLYELRDGSLYDISTREAVDVPERDDILPFFEVLALCHTVQIERLTPQSVMKRSSSDNLLLDDDGSQFVYHASSPDEKALVEACRGLGVVYHGAFNNNVEVRFSSLARNYVLHDVLEFDSTRKCMSTLIEDDRGDFYVFCKGAESSVLEKCTLGLTSKAMEHVNYYAALGLRTLVIAFKKVDADMFKNYLKVLEDAKQDISNRDEALLKAYQVVEDGFTVLGVTAVEDKLQDSVKETIEKLRLAGIKVWVLTGDKEETAVNISYSAGHFEKSTAFHALTQQTNETDAYSTLFEVKRKLDQTDHERFPAALVIDGSSLSLVMKRHHELLREVCVRCSAVLCCRMTPIQKAEVVRLVKDDPSKPTTAAIGDGANDVSMIQEADLGIGIMGKEGRHAARSSDFAFGRFKFLQRAILLHGHYFYKRLAILVQYFFYKNLAFITMNFYYTFFSAYSAMSVYDTIFLLFYNITFTSLPVYLYGLFEQHIPQEYLLKHPSIYKRLRKNEALSWSNFTKWNAVGLWHSVVAMFGVYAMFYFHDEFGNNRQMTDIFAFGTAVLFVCMLSVTTKLMIHTYYWTWITVLGYAITIFGNWGMIAIYCRWTYTFTSGISMSGVLGVLFASPIFWLTSVLLVVTSVLPDLFSRGYCDVTNPLNEKLSQPSDAPDGRVPTANGAISKSMKSKLSRISEIELEPVRLVGVKAYDNLGMVFAE